MTSGRAIRQVLLVSGAALFVLLGLARPVRAADKADPKAAKIGVYIQMINTWGNTVADSRTRYWQTVDKTKGLTCKEPNIGATHPNPEQTSGSGLNLKDLPKFRTALKKSPALPTDASATRMVDAMAQILAIDNNYFYDAKFLGDDCKRGKEIHALLLATWPKFFDAEREVRAAVDTYTDERELLKLSEAEKKYGKTSLHWYERKLLLDAKTLVKAVEAAGREPLPDPAPLHTNAAALRKTYDEAHPVFQKFNAQDSGNNSDYSYMLSYADVFAAKTETLARNMEDDFKKKRSSPYLQGQISELVKAYNTMIDAANRVTYSKAMK